MTVLASLAVIFAAISAYLYKTHYMPSTDNDPLIPVIVDPPAPPVVPATPSIDTPQPLPWDTPQKAYHGVRVLCDLGGLTLTQKNILCACVFQESRFRDYDIHGAPVQNWNKDKNGKVWSTDWGIAQVNDYYNIGPGKPFKSVGYVLENPDKVIEWMVRIYKTTGELGPWASFTSEAYRQWLPASSPMWKLAVHN